jgi:hypothetical protein
MNKYIMVDRNEIFDDVIYYGTLEKDMRQYKVLSEFDSSGHYVIYDKEFGYKTIPTSMLASSNPHKGSQVGRLGTAFVSQKYAERIALFNQILSGDVIVEMGV